MVTGIVLFILAAVIALIGLVLWLYKVVTLVRSPMVAINYQKAITNHAILAGVFVIGLTLLFIAIPIWNNWSMQPWEWACTIVGGFFFALLGAISLETFILHYYGKNLPIKLNKWLFIILMVAFPLMFVMIFVFSDGYALHLTYPLINGISFSGEIPTPEHGGALITFYALCILSGAVYAYLLCDHKFYLQYGKHGILESTFLVAFPAGIIGARIFYVIGNWNLEFKDNPISMFYIWQGGLTILGGAITGIVVGVAWFKWRNKGYNIWLVVDIIIPTILLAQAVGRWGNFFNCEVHGVLVDEKAGSWLPLVVYKNAHYSSTSGWAPEGQIYVPLFFIESLVNLLGFFVLSHVFGKALRRYTQLGDIAFGYLIWYGLTRAFMEPLRDGAYNMGTNGYWSWFWSMIFVIAGSLLIALNHFVRYFLDKKNGTYFVKKRTLLVNIIGSSIALCIGITGLIIAINLMMNSTFSQTISYSPFNIGIIILVISISSLLYLFITIPNVIEGIKNTQHHNE